MFIKVVENNSWDFGEPVGSLVKVSSRGLVGTDKQAFVKRASAELIDKIDSMEFKPGEVPVHLIAMGSTESYGPNRNGDGFSKEACENYHHYFVKDARVYRNHKNTDKSKSYGIVKASAYNKEMDRVELIVAFNGDKKAADANGGLVADKEMDKLAASKDVPVSMACTPDPEMPVLTKEHGYLGIGRIKVGMHVWTKECRWKQVTCLNKRNYTGTIYEFSIRGLPAPLKFTSEHPLWIKDNNDCFRWINAEQIIPDMCAVLSCVPQSIISKKSQDLFSTLKKDGTIYSLDSYTTCLQIRDLCLNKGLPVRCVKESENGTDKYKIWIGGDTVQFRSANPMQYTANIWSIVNYNVTDIPVYNIEVEEDESYSAAGIVSHNCKVPYDQCSYCGNKAATRDEYCKDESEGGHCKAGGLYHNMGKTASVNGNIHQLYADNTKPYFFDISHVFVPADRIAYTTGVLTKKASSNFVSGADLAELYGMYSSQTQKQACFQGMTPDYAHAVKCLCNAVTDFHTGEIWKKQANFLAVEDDAPIENTRFLTKFASYDVTAALNKAKRCLTASQFLQLAVERPYNSVTKIASVIAPLSNEVFSNLLVDNDGYNPYISHSAVPSRLYDWAESQKCVKWTKEAGFKQAALNSIQQKTYKGCNPGVIYALRDDPNAEKLSKDYALYKVAFLTSIPKEERPKMAALLVGRDYLSY